MTLPSQGFQQHGGEVGVVFSVGVLTDGGLETLHDDAQPRLRVRGLEPPRGDPQVHAVDGREVGEREGCDLEFDGADALGQGRLRHIRGAQGA